MRVTTNKTVVTSRDKRRRRIESKFAAPDQKTTLSHQATECPDRMEVIYRDNVFSRWLVLTPREWNLHQGYFVAIPVTVDRTHVDPFEYPFFLDRQNQIALCSQPKSIKLEPPYISLGRLTRADHEAVSRLMIKILCDAEIANSL